MRPFPGKLIASVSGLLGVVLIGVVDWVTGVEISVSILYLLPIGFTVWFGGRIVGCSVAVAAALAWLAQDLAGAATHSHPWVPYWNAMVRFGFFLTTTLLLDRIRILNDNLEALVKQRTAALESEMAQRKRLEREAVEICQREQERVAHELHDHVGSCLAGVGFRLKTLVQKLQQRAAPETAAAAEAYAAVSTAMEQVRSFSRILAVTAGPRTGLKGSLTQLGQETERVFGTKCVVNVADEVPELSFERVHHVHQIAQEAVRNAVRHARPRQILISVQVIKNQLALTIQNDGKRWDPTETRSSGIGLRIMRHRAALLGGNLSMEPAGSEGAILNCQVPLEPPPVSVSPT